MARYILEKLQLIPSYCSIVTTTIITVMTILILIDFIDYFL